MRTIALVLALTLGAACGGKQGPAPAPPAQASLYVRLGEQPAIERVVDKFLANVTADARINKFFAGLDAAAVAKLRGHLIDQVCNASGGPCAYTGRDMVTVHTGMNLTDADFDALVEDLVAALDEYQVPRPEQDELLGVLGGMRSQIVGK